MPCPAGLVISDATGQPVGTSTAPAKRGTPVSLRPADGNTFGQLTTLTGEVRFKRAGEPDVVVPAAEVVWSATLVQLFSVPNLSGPLDGQPVTWTIHLTPAEIGASACSYSFVVEAFAPGQSCPTAVRVSNGVYGSAAQPAQRAQPIFLTALSGQFGGSTTTSGTVAFTSAAYAPKQFAAPNVVWQGGQVQFGIPADLPATGGPAVWEVRLTATGATAPCGPYPVVVEGGSLTKPSSVAVASIPNLPARTDPRGQPVTLFAVGGFFGGALAAKGTVVLTRTGYADVPVPADDVVWTPVAVTFLLPDLPDTQGVAQWEALLTPDGGAPLGPYRLDVVAAEPLLVFAPPFAISEERIELVAIGLAGRPELPDPPVLSLLAEDMAGNKLYGGKLGPPPRGRRTPLGVSVTVPTVLALRQSPQCGPNQLYMDVNLRLQITQGSYSKTTNPLRTTVVMPPPLVGRFSRDGDVLTLGLPRGTTGTTGGYRGCEWLGPLQHGKVQLIEPPPATGSTPAPDPNLAKLDAALDQLASDLPSGPGALTPASSPFPSNLADLQAVKAPDPAQRRRFLDVVVENGDAQWTEERIEVKLDRSIKAGTIVVWRDDLPSLPITFVDPPTLPQIACSTAAVQPLVQQLFRPLGVPAAGQVLPVGQVLSLAVEQIPNATNALSAYLQPPPLGGSPPVSISFRLELRKNGGAPPTNSVRDTAANQVSATSSFPLTLGVGRTLQLRPDVVALTGTPGSATWSVQIVARVTGLPTCGGPIDVDLQPPLAFAQANLPIPKIVIGIRGPNYREGWLLPPNGIVFAHPSTPGLGGRKVDKLSGELAVTTARNTLIGQIDAVRNLLGLVSGFAGLPGPTPIPSIGVIDGTGSVLDTPLETALNTIARANWQDLTFDGTEATNDLNQNRDPWWQDRIESLVMLSAPIGPALQLWEHTGRTGQRMVLRMPAGHIVGGYRDLHDLSWDQAKIGTFPGAPTTWATNNFYANVASSFNWIP